MDTYVKREIGLMGDYCSIPKGSFILAGAKLSKSSDNDHRRQTFNTLFIIGAQGNNIRATSYDNNHLSHSSFGGAMHIA